MRTIDFLSSHPKIPVHGVSVIWLLPALGSVLARVDALREQADILAQTREQVEFDGEQGEFRRVAQNKKLSYLSPTTKRVLAVAGGTFNRRSKFLNIPGKQFPDHLDVASSALDKLAPGFVSSVADLLDDMEVRIAADDCVNAVEARVKAQENLVSNFPSTTANQILHQTQHSYIASTSRAYFDNRKDVLRHEAKNVALVSLGVVSEPIQFLYLPVEKDGPWVQAAAARTAF